MTLHRYTEQTDAAELERLLLPKDVADVLNVNMSWVYRAARDGHLPCVKVGRWVRFKRADVEAFIATGGAEFDGPTT